MTASTVEHTEPVTQTRLYGAHRDTGEVIEVQAEYHWDTKVRREKKPVKVREPGGRVVDAKGRTRLTRDGQVVIVEEE